MSSAKKLIAAQPCANPQANQKRTLSYIFIRESAGRVHLTPDGLHARDDVPDLFLINLFCIFAASPFPVTVKLQMFYSLMLPIQ